jgi:hypothetical protein
MEEQVAGSVIVSSPLILVSRSFAAHSLVTSKTTDASSVFATEKPVREDKHKQCCCLREVRIDGESCNSLKDRRQECTSRRGEVRGTYLTVDAIGTYRQSR